jgi:hypothetical protein
LEYKYPIDSDGLTEEEFLIYRDVVSHLNEAKSFPELKNINDSVKYEKLIYCVCGIAAVHVCICRAGQYKYG